MSNTYDVYNELVGLSLNKVVSALLQNGWGLYADNGVFPPSIPYDYSLFYTQYGPPSEDQPLPYTPVGAAAFTMVNGGNLLRIGYNPGDDTILYSHSWYESGQGDLGFQVISKVVNGVFSGLTYGLSDIAMMAFNNIDTGTKQIVDTPSVPVDVQPYYQPTPVDEQNIPIAAPPAIITETTAPTTSDNSHMDSMDPSTQIPGSIDITTSARPAQTASNSLKWLGFAAGLFFLTS